MKDILAKLDELTKRKKLTESHNVSEQLDRDKVKEAEWDYNPFKDGSAQDYGYEGDTEDYIIKLWNQGMDVKEIAAELDADLQLVKDTVDNYEDDDYYDDEPDIDDPAHDEGYARNRFAEPGSGSALHAADETNPRSYPCPSCERENMLTKKDVMKGYQCDRCADAAEGYRPQYESKKGLKDYINEASVEHARNKEVEEAVRLGFVRDKEFTRPTNPSQRRALANKAKEIRGTARFLKKKGEEERAQYDDPESLGPDVELPQAGLASIAKSPDAPFKNVAVAVTGPSEREHSLYKPKVMGARAGKMNEAEQIQVVPANQKAMLIKQGDKTLGTVTNPNLAQQIKSSIGKGEMTLAGSKLGEDMVSEESVMSFQTRDDDESMDYHRMADVYKEGDGYTVIFTTSAPGMRAPNPLRTKDVKQAEMVARKYTGNDMISEAKKAKNDAYAIGMAAAKKASGIKAKHATDLPKSVIKKGHDIGKKIKKKQGVAEAEIPKSGPDFGAGLGAGRSSTTLEAKKKNTSYAGALPGVSNATYERIIAAAEAAHEKGKKGDVMRILQDAKSALWSMEDFKREPDPKVKKRHVKLAKLYKARVDEQINEASEPIPGSVEHLASLIRRAIKHKEAEHAAYMRRGATDSPARQRMARHNSELENIDKEAVKYFGDLKDGSGTPLNKSIGLSQYVSREDGPPLQQAKDWMHKLGKSKTQNEETYQQGDVTEGAKGKKHAAMKHDKKAEQAGKKVAKEIKEAEIPGSQVDLGAGLGAGRSRSVLESPMDEPVIINTPEGIKYMQMAAARGAINLEKKGLRHSKIGSVKNKWAKHLGMRPRATHDAVIAELEKRMQKIKDNLSETKISKAVKAGKKVAKDIEYDEKVKDKIHGKKRHAEDEKAEKAGKKVTKDLKYDMKKSTKKKVKESMNPKLKAAYQEGYAHGLREQSCRVKHYEDMEEAKKYYEGYKCGLDEFYGMMPVQGLVVGEGDMPPATVSGMAQEMLGIDENLTSVGMTDDRAAKMITDKLKGMPGINAGNIDRYVSRYLDMVGKHPTDLKHLSVLVLGNLQDMGLDEAMLMDAELDEMMTDIEEMSRGEYISHMDKKAEHAGKDTFDAFGQKFNTDEVDEGWSMEEDSNDMFESLDKQLNDLLNEGLSVSVSTGQPGMQGDSVSVNATDDDAAQLLDFVKKVGLGGLSAEEKHEEPAVAVVHSDYGAPSHQPDDRTSMLALMKKMNGEDYEQESDEGSCGCEAVSEMETDDQREFQVAEGDGEDAEVEMTDHDEDAEAKEDEALAINNIKEEEYGPPRSKPIYTGPEGTLWRVSDADTWKKVASGTKWDVDMIEHYLGKGPIYVLEVPNDKKYAVHFPTGIAADSMNKEIEPEMLKKIKKLISGAGGGGMNMNIYTEEAEELTELNLLLKKLPGRKPTSDDLSPKSRWDASDNSGRPRIDTDPETYKNMVRKGKSFSGPRGELPESELTEWANDAGKKGTDEAFEADIDFMTNVITAGLNGRKSTGQTTVPVIAGQTARTGADSFHESKGSIAAWQKLCGIR